jgi:hypothetical protein
MSGYMRPSILWHLSRVGAADVATLARIIGRPKQATATVVRRMRGQHELADRPYSHGQFELTAKGREAASRVNAQDVETAQCVEQLVQETRSRAQDAESLALASKCCDLIATASSHAVGLEALLRAYEAVGRTHPCCTQAAANAAMQTSMRLAAAAAAGRPADAPIH